MASLILTPENQIQRLNTIVSKVNTVRKLDAKALIVAKKPKTWSVVEIIAHLNIAYELYADRLDDLLQKLPNHTNGYVSFKARRWQRLVIEGTRPKGKQRKWKMKTLKKFEPLLDIKSMDSEGIAEVFQKFEALHLHLKNGILESRSKEVTNMKIDSAIGPIVKFYLPECFEFLLAHLERHMVQIDHILNRNELNELSN